MHLFNLLVTRKKYCAGLKRNTPVSGSQTWPGFVQGRHLVQPEGDIPQYPATQAEQ